MGVAQRRGSTGIERCLADALTSHQCAFSLQRASEVSSFQT